MIITTQKPFAEILRSLDGHRRVFLIGCAACATTCQTGGEEALKTMAGELKAKGKEIIGSVILDTPCDIRVAKKDLKKFSFRKDDAALVLACGAGVQSIEKAIDVVLLPALDPLFTGTTERIGMYHEYCALCGDCILERTGGLCPVARCTKGLLNGPCGGVIDGKCEVEQERDCVWVLILDKLKKTGRNADVLREYQPPRTVPKPKKLVRARHSL